MEVGKYGHPSTHVGGPRQQNHHAMNARILNNPHARRLQDLIGIPTWGLGFIPQSAWVHLEQDKNLIETIWASKVAYAKPLKVAWGARNWTLESNKHNRTKEMDTISKYHDFEIIHGQCISIPFFFFKHCLHLNMGIFILFFFVFLC
jgi:hypothetical protein